MSIVYDYLKKIQDKKEPEKVTPIPAAPIVKKSAGSFPWVKVMAGILMCSLLGAGLYFFLPKFLKTEIKIPQIPQKARPVRPAIPDFNFLLEGIIYNPSKPFAIFDGKMYEVGGKFGDFEIVKITPDTVDLKNLKDNTSRTAHL
jgi:hypothetical protein